jgi:lipopolysaccharide transport system permease protein
MTEQPPLIVYTPQSQLREPHKFVSAMWRDILAARELAWQLTVREIKVRYRQSLLGVLWAFLPPIATATVFIVLNTSGVLTIETTSIPYPLFALVGTVLWQLFNQSINAPLGMVTRNKSILAKINFPREALILSAVGVLLFDFAISFIILCVAFVIFSVPLTWGLPLAFLLIFVLMLMGITIGMFITPLGILYKDISSGMPTLLNFWFFLTPVIYPPATEGLFATLTRLNPVTPLLVGARELMTTGSITELLPVLIVSVVVSIALFIMWMFYRLSFSVLIERMGD